MVVSSNPLGGPQSARVRAARGALLATEAIALMEQVRGVFCEPSRSQIVRALSAGSLSVNDIALVIGHSKSSTSQHLRVLRHNGVVTTRRRGRTILYGLAHGPIATTAVKAIDVVAAAA